MRDVVAALFVQPGGAYYGIDGVEPWGLPERDAREYAGPWPVVAHPPCARWGRYWSGGPNPRQTRKILGDDGGCFAAALASVRRWGGVLEHPEASHAWRHFDLISPPKSGGWIPADLLGGWTCCVEQGHYGHAARKATWLYTMRVDLPSLRWGASCSSGPRIDPGYHSKEEARARRLERSVMARMSARARAATPGEFRDLLISMARSVGVNHGA